MEEIKINILYNYKVGLASKGRCGDAKREIPKDERGRDTYWLLTEVNFGVRGEKHKPCSFMFEVCKKGSRTGNLTVVKKSELFNIPYNTNHHTQLYDKHFVIKSGLFIIPVIIEVGQNSEDFTVFLKLEEHYDNYGCCADKAPLQNMSKYVPANVVNNILLTDDL